MNSVWSTVKNICSDKRSKVNILMELITARSTRFLSELVALRPLTTNPDSRRALEGIISIMRTLPSNIKGMEAWCVGSEQAFDNYIDSFVVDEPHCQQRKAPFLYLEELCDFLQLAESRKSMPMGVTVISRLCNASRRTLFTQMSDMNINNFEFSQACRFGTNKRVSASFNPIDIVERQSFDFSIESADHPELNTSGVAELLLLQAHGNKSLAICRIEDTGRRMLLYPCFRGHELDVKLADGELVLSAGSHSLHFEASAKVLGHWDLLLSKLFNSEEPRQRSRHVSGLGIVFGNSSSATNNSAASEVEQHLVRDESYDSFAIQDATLSKSALTSSTSKLSRISIGLPAGFTDDLKNLIAEIPDEDFVDAPSEPISSSSAAAAASSTSLPTAAAPPVLAPVPLSISTDFKPPRALFAAPTTGVPSPTSLYMTASEESLTSLFATPPAIDQRAEMGVVPSPPPEPFINKPPSAEEIETAKQKRSRIGNSILAREKQMQQRSTFLETVSLTPSRSMEEDEQQSAAQSLSASHSIFSTEGLLRCSESLGSVASHSVPDLTWNSRDQGWNLEHQCDSVESLPVTGGEVKKRGIPAATAAASASAVPVAGAAQRVPPAIPPPILTQAKANPSDDSESSDSALSSDDSMPPRKTKNTRAKSAGSEAGIAQNASASPSNSENLQVLNSPASRSQSAQSAAESRAKAKQAEISWAGQSEANGSTETLRDSSCSYQRPLNFVYKSTSEQSLKKAMNRSDSAGSGLGVAVCTDSHNRTIAVGAAFQSSSSLNSSMRSLASSHSLESHLSNHSRSTMNTSIGSSGGWDAFMNGVRSEAAKTVDLAKTERVTQQTIEARREVEEHNRRLAEQARKEQETAELTSKSLAPAFAGLVTTTQPLIRRLVEESRAKAEEKPAADTAKTNPNSNTMALVTPKKGDRMETRGVLTPPHSAGSIISSASSIDSASRRSPVPNRQQVQFFDQLGLSQSRSPSPPSNSTSPIFSAPMWVSKWSVSRWKPLSQLELTIEIFNLGRGSTKINVISQDRVQQLAVTANSDLRQSGRHDIQLRVNEDTYMFRSRASETATMFFACMSAQLSRSEFMPVTIRDSDAASLSTISSNTDETVRRTYLPPLLSKPRRLIPVSTASMTIYEEDF